MQRAVLDFLEGAWHDPERRDMATERHPIRGLYYVSIGCATAGKPLKMVWRWQQPGDVVWPITAFFPKGRPQRRR